MKPTDRSNFSNFRSARCFRPLPARTLVSAALASALLLSAAFSACNQAPIFYDISQEEAPKDPRIAGTPTNLVLYDGYVYVASQGSDTIHRYKDGSWSTIGAPGAVRALAATTGTNAALYAVTASAGNLGSAQIHMIETLSTSTVNAPSGFNGHPMSIYGAGTKLYIGTYDGSTYRVYENDGTTSSVTLKVDGGILNGAADAGGSYYAATSKGLYKDGGLVGEALNVVGVIANGSDIYAPTRSSTILDGSGAIIGGGTLSSLRYSGATALWGTDANSPTTVLLGVQNSSSTTTSNNGYRELPFGGSIIVPGEGGSITMNNNSRFKSSIALYTVHSIIQAPDGRTFASTSRNGVWSIQGDTWNAED